MRDERRWKTTAADGRYPSPISSQKNNTVAYMKSHSLLAMRACRKMSAYLAAGRQEETCLDYAAKCLDDFTEPDIHEPIMTTTRNGSTQNDLKSSKVLITTTASLDVIIADVYTLQSTAHRWRMIFSIALNLGGFLGNIGFTLAATITILFQQIAASTNNNNLMNNNWERFLILAVSSAECLCLMALLFIHLARYRYWKSDKIYPWRVIIGLGRFSSFEMLKLWNPFYLQHYLQRLWRKLQISSSRVSIILFLAIQIMGMLLAIFSPFALYLKVKNVAMLLRNPTISYESFTVIPLFLINFIGFLADRDPLVPWAVLTQRYASQGNVDINSVQCDDCFQQTVFLEDYYWKRVWDESLAMLGPEAKWFVLGGMERPDLILCYFRPDKDTNESQHAQSA